MKLRIASAARLDLREVAAYIARDNPKRAVSYIDELNDKIRLVANQPLAYPARDDWKPGLRSATFHRYHIVHRIATDTVEIMRVIHGSRDIPALLEI